jgi:hypothetical protein
MQPQDNVIRTTMDAGPKKVRRRYTAGTKTFSGKQILNAEMFETFKVFYHTVLADGVLRFNFTDPMTLETAEFRFSAPYTAAAADGFFEVAVALERVS